MHSFIFATCKSCSTTWRGGTLDVLDRHWVAFASYDQRELVHDNQAAEQNAFTPHARSALLPNQKGHHASPATNTHSSARYTTALWTGRLSTHARS